MSGLPKPRSMTSSPARRSSCFSRSTVATAYGGSESLRLNSPTRPPAVRIPPIVSARGLHRRRRHGRRRGVRVRGARVSRPEMAMGLGAVAARNRDVELGVAPHAVLADVEARGFDLL